MGCNISVGQNSKQYEGWLDEPGQVLQPKECEEPKPKKHVEPKPKKRMVSANCRLMRKQVSP